MQRLELIRFFHNLSWLALVALAGLILPSLPAEAADLAAEITGAPAVLRSLRQRLARWRNSRSTRSSPGRNPQRSRVTSASGPAAAGPIGG